MVINIKNKPEKKDLLRNMFSKEWFEFLKPFILSKDFRTILEFLNRECELGINVTPCFPDIFRAFQTCPFKELNTIIIGPEPYNNLSNKGILIADGNAFSARYTNTPPRVLRNIYRALREDNIIRNPTDDNITDLDYLSCQGVLLLNASLTGIVGRRGQHRFLWDNFTRYLVQKINAEKEYIGVILMGAHARSLRKDFTNKTFSIVECENPDLPQNEENKWDHNKCFLQIDGFHSYTNNININW